MLPLVFVNAPLVVNNAANTCPEAVNLLAKWGLEAPMALSELLRLRKAAELLGEGITERTLRAEIHAGRLQFVKLGAVGCRGPSGRLSPAPSPT
jgi:hypothetical protein